MKAAEQTSILISQDTESGSRNIVVFSDGTGQDGGIRPEQRLSNIFKMYRAARVGPDNNIDPSKQVAFYDPGLGTDASATGLTSLRRWWTKLMSSVTGRGITKNIADCYEFLINHYRPGDRIWLFGFSRGAYTARCVANVLMLCGIPTRDGAKPLPRFSGRIREIADRAVIRVYEHGAGKERLKYDAQRWELASRFRAEFGSGGDDESNAAPYFIGAFDTVASLGAKGPLRIALAFVVAAVVGAAATLLAASIHYIFGFNWTASLLSAVVLAGAYAAWSYVSTSLKVVWPPMPGTRLPQFHFAQWSGRNFDRLLSKSVRYARHAISIDEDRADFPRLPWGGARSVQGQTELEGETKPFVQLWFSGNHSDIGGSYPEVESRLSDVALEWMIQEARSVAHPLIFNDDRLQLFPSSGGLQHDEVLGMSEMIRNRTPRLFRRLTAGLTWSRANREPVPDATLHPTVAERFALASVPGQGAEGPYRPEALRRHNQFKHLY